MTLVPRDDDVTFEAYKIGATVISPQRRIYESDVMDIGRFTNDMRAVFAGEDPLIMSPLHVFSLGLCLLLHGGPIAYIPRPFVAFLGFSSVDFIADVRVGDIVRSEATVAELEERHSSGAITWDHRIINQNSEVVIRSRHAILVQKAGD